MAPESELREPQRVYNMPGLTFTAAELFREINAHLPGFAHHQKINANMDKFAKLWPDTLSPDETLRDLDYEPEVTLPRMVAAVLNAHSGRRMTSRAGFRSIDTCAQPSLTQTSARDARCCARTLAPPRAARFHAHAHEHLSTSRC